MCTTNCRIRTNNRNIILYCSEIYFWPIFLPAFFQSKTIFEVENKLALTGTKKKPIPFSYFVETKFDGHFTYMRNKKKAFQAPGLKCCYFQMLWNIFYHFNYLTITTWDQYIRVFFCYFIMLR